MILPRLRKNRTSEPIAAFLLAAVFLTTPTGSRSGDLLRGGASPAAGANRTAAATRSAAAAAALARANAKDNLARTTRAIQAMQTMQTAARNAAVGNNAGQNPNAPGTILPNVPNGLGAGGLQVDPGVSGGSVTWSGANLPSQTSNGNRTTVNIEQTQQTSLLSWETFNVGRKTTLQFDQTRGGSETNKWIAFNRVNDPSSAPSQILGSIEAPGQVYVINRNGIIFGAGSQVNVGTLVASSLPINTNLIERGLLNNPDAQFLFSGIAIPAGSQGTPAFTPDPVNPAIGRYGDVIVQKGAEIATPQTADNSGGRVMLVAPNVQSAGSIETPDGQTILAAGMQVGINAHSSSDPGLRGLDVYVGSVTPSGGGAEVGLVQQSGIITSKRGSITLAGREIRQSGALMSTTSVSLNGRIEIDASYDAISNTGYNPASSISGSPFLQQKTGTVRFGAGSVTRILPELGSSETVIGRTLALRSNVNVTGRAIHVGRDAAIQAPSGDITVSAGEWRVIGLGGASPNSRFISSIGQVYLDRNALIDVAGSTGVSVSVLQHLLTLELRGAELANSPLQRDSILRNLAITVDARNTGTYGDNDWVGTPLADATGFAGIVQRTIDEFTTPGGNVTIAAGESVVMQEGSTIDVSGGYLNYKGAKVKTTRLLLNGNVIDIKDATPNRTYDGIYTGKSTIISSRWGVRDVYDQPLALTGERYEEGYIEGAAAGHIDIAAPGMALDGNLIGRNIDGPRQQEAGSGLSSLRLAFLSQDTSYPSFPTYSPTPPTVSFQTDSNLAAPGAFSVDANGDPGDLAAGRLRTVYLDPNLLDKNGIGHLTVENPDGAIVVPKDVTLTTKAGGSVTLDGTNLRILGDIYAPGGEIDLTANNLSLSAVNFAEFNRVKPSVAPGRGIFVLGKDSVLSTAGLRLDDRLIASGLSIESIEGGNISIAGYDVRLGSGSLVDVSGGAIFGSDGEIDYGNGGTLSIQSGRDTHFAEVFGGGLSLGGRLRGYSGAEGGALKLSALAFQIGGNRAPARVTHLTPGFFSTGGFTNFSLTGMGLPTGTPDRYTPGINVIGGTKIRPVADSFVGVFNPNGQTGGKLVPYTMPEGLRTPVSLSFKATGLADSFNAGLIISRGDLVFGRDASIVTDGGGNIAFSGETSSILGRVVARGGNISISGSGSFPLSGEALATVYIGSNAVLNTAGKVITREGLNGWRTGEILPGGNISISGNIVAESGAVMNVSGTAGTLDLPAPYRSTGAKPQTGLGGQRYVPVRFETDGGTITLAGAQSLFTDATLVGRPGGTSANGGTLNISSGRYVAPGDAFTSTEENLIIVQGGNTIPVSSFARGIGLGVRDASGAALPGIGYFAADRFQAGGFGSLDLGGNVSFEGPVSIDAPSSLRVADGGVIYADDSVRLKASYVALGRDFLPPALAADDIIRYTQTDINGVTTPYFFSPTEGSGSLSVQADHIDIGDLSLQGISNATLRATKGDIRGDGTFQMVGNLTLQAGQIYPATLTEFNIFAYDRAGSQGSITVLNGASRAVPLSAGGSLALYASNITQLGTLRAPVGSITLGWDGTSTAPSNPIAGSTKATPETDQLTLGSNSLTSVSAIDARNGRAAIIPFGISFDGNSWIDPAGNDITVGGVPSKTINLAGNDVETQSGSVIDVRGGGDLYAYRWIEGNGGSSDILASDNLFAIIPGYGFDYAPFAPFNNSSLAANLQGEDGYTNSTLHPGVKITVGASPGLAAGTYTLLPARYALLPGAFLVTPKGGAPVGTRSLDEGSTLVSGYRSNDLDPGRAGRTEMARFEISSGDITRQRAEYQDLFANKFLKKSASSRGFDVPRLPTDSGYLSFASTNSIDLAGQVLASAAQGGRGALIDFNSSSDILINEDGSGGGPGILVLKAGQINRLGAESLLLGGLRSDTANGTELIVNTQNITIDTGNTALIGSDFIFAANEVIEVKDGSIIQGVGNTPVDSIFIGDESITGSGDGSLLRVSGSKAASVVRYGVGNSTQPALLIGADTMISGGSVTADSTYASVLDPRASLISPVLALNSGQISIRTDNSVAINSTVGLILSGEALDTIQEVTRELSLLSYSSFDVYGTGTVGSRDLELLSIQAGSIVGYNQAGGDFQFSADRIVIGNSADAGSAVPPAPLNGSLTLDANEITLGSNDLNVGGFDQLTLAADSRLIVSGQGSFSSMGDIEMITPLVTGEAASIHRIATAGNLRLTRPAGVTAGTAGGLGADLTLEGATVQIESDIVLNSGEISLRASTGDLDVGSVSSAKIDTSGISRDFLDVTRYTSGGTINLTADQGSVMLGSNSTVDVSASGGDAGFLNVKAPLGSFSLGGTILGSAGTDRRSGSFSLDAATVAGNNLTVTDAALNFGLFNESRSYRLRSGDFEISGLAKAREYLAFADTGSIHVSGTIDASGTTGGTIELNANGDLVIRNGALLDASADEFNAAGKGGSVYLGAGASYDRVIDSGATLDLQAGSTIDLTVAALNATSASRGQYTGTLHLRAPQNAAHTDLQMEAIGSQIDGASAIVVEGYRIYDRAGNGGALDNALLATIKADGETFLGTAGAPGGFYSAMQSRLTNLQPALDLILSPGAEIVNLSGSLQLGSTTSTEADDWNLAALRFGPNSAAGILTLRARDDINLYNAISDGFSGGSSLWLSPLTAYNPLLPANSQSWSYRMTAGADFKAADTGAARPVDLLSPGLGMIRLGKNAGATTATGGTNATTASIITNRFQVIRTGSGFIDINAGRTLQLLNPFASIYTAGTQVADPTGVINPGDFVTPILTAPIGQGSLGAVQQTYPAQYAAAGGNVSIHAGVNIERKTENNSGLIDDASRQLPNNWLYRRGYVGPDGTFGRVTVGTGFITFNDPAASTSWWVDYSNFFQSVGALGGGNVSLVAGNEVRNIDAVIPTNARAPRGIPDPDTLIELGGGDLLVKSGGDISGGVYYVERGVGRIEAGGSVTTNAARSPSLGTIQNLNNPTAAQYDELSWIPTTLFMGRSSFDVSARGDVLLGPIANAFLLPQGVNNRYWYKTYFSTYGEDSSVKATSLGGDVTFRNAVTLPQRGSATDTLRAWIESQNLLASGSSGAAFTQPWLRLAETSLDPFAAAMRLAPANLEATALAGDINLSGSVTLSPSSTGQLELVAAGQVNAFQPTGKSNLLVPGESVQSWAASQINISDADPSAIPGTTNPFNYFSLVGSSTNLNNSTRSTFYEPISRLFTDSRSTAGSFGVSTTKQALHASDLLHRNDTEPVRIYALDGDISGLTLFSPKESRIYASRDITDISFYLQNLDGSDNTVISAGRDIIPYNASSILRNASLASGNAPANAQFPSAGDIHLGGPGSLEVLAGRDLDLGTGTANSDGSGSGILTIGNTRNPSLPFEGADLIAGAGLGTALSLSASDLDLQGFINKYVSSPSGKSYLAELGVSNFNSLDEEEQAKVALDVFYLILRDTGRNFNDPKSDGFQNYDTGFAAVKELFGNGKFDGEILSRARNIRTQNGGDISLFAPGGGVTLANTTIGDPLIPPGIVTESGGSISIFTDQSVDIGVGRIFTLRGGDMVIWSSKGDIAAGVASKTVQSAPPTRVLIDPQSGAVVTDLAGLSTGGGIGVLATVAGVKPGNVDLIAPTGVIDAGDAGIRVTGNINLAATQVLNASNIAAGGSSSGAPTTVAASGPSVGGLSSASNAAAASTAAADSAAESAREQSGTETLAEATPSVITVEVLGYGGGGGSNDDDEEENSGTEAAQ